MAAWTLLRVASWTLAGRRRVRETVMSDTPDSADTSFSVTFRFVRVILRFPLGGSPSHAMVTYVNQFVDTRMSSGE